ncbi:HEAT repeat domain-containing protein [Candidatus Poribacteria bacterium]
MLEAVKLFGELLVFAVLIVTVVLAFVMLVLRRLFDMISVLVSVRNDIVIMMGRDSEDDRAYAAATLGSEAKGILVRRRVAKALIGTLQDTEAPVAVRASAAGALSEVGYRRGQYVLMSVVADRSIEKYVRIASMSALSCLGVGLDKVMEIALDTSDQEMAQWALLAITRYTKSKNQVISFVRSEIVEDMTIPGTVRDFAARVSEVLQNDGEIQPILASISRNAENDRYVGIMFSILFGQNWKESYGIV